MKRLLLFGIALFLTLAPATAETVSVVRVMTFNLWHGGDQGGQPLSQSAKVIQSARADLIGLQETAGLGADPRPDNAAKLAGALGFHYYNQGSGRGILSRYPVVTNSPARFGVKVRISPAQEAWIFNVHFAHAPYQPYQLLGIPYEGGAFLKTSAEAIAAAEAARGAQVRQLLAELETAQESGLPLFLTGDFNEPSHQDWTGAATAARLCPLAVEWPTTKAVVKAGLVDSFRAARPDAVKDRGLTWTPITSEDASDDRHDRIDFVFFQGAALSVLASEVVGERSERADIVVAPYPSDHRAVVSTFQFRR